MFKRLNLHNLIRYILVLALLTPLVFTSFTLYPTYYGKTMVFQLLIEIALLLYLILVLRGEVKEIKTGYIFWLVVLYLGIRTITGFFGINPEKSFWGTQGRMGGNFTWLHLLTFFFLPTLLSSPKITPNMTHKTPTSSYKVSVWRQNKYPMVADIGTLKNKMGVATLAFIRWKARVKQCCE